MMKKILIIKLGAKGDVIRTLPLLKAIKEKFPVSEISWITKSNISDLIENNPLINKIFNLDSYPKEPVDILYNFDIEDEATKIAIEIEAKEKCGFYSEQGFPAAFNLEAEYYLNTLFDDELKKANRKTYQEMMFEAAKLPHKKNLPEILLTEKDQNYAKKFIEDNSLISKKILGIHIGASPRWPSKKWSKEKIKEFIEKAANLGHSILFFGGPNETEDHSRLYEELKEKGIEIIRNNPLNTNGEFASLISVCDKVVCLDSFALHVSLALKKPTIALFFCTTPHEVEGYGLLTKITSPLLESFFPEKMDLYDEELVNSISVQEVIGSLNEKAPVKAVNAIILDKENNKFLIIKRKKGEIHANKWAFPGGVVKEGESIEQALSREIKEETNLEIEKIIIKISEYEYPREDGSKTNGECYLVKTKNNYASKTQDIEDFKWVDLSEFEKMDIIEGLDKEASIAYLNNNK